MAQQAQSARQPRKLGYFAVILYNLTGGRLYHGRTTDPAGVLVLTTTGRKSGQQRSVSLIYIRDGASYVVTASNAGKDTHPGWYFNLRSHPEAQIRLKDQTIPVVAEEANPEQRQRLWEQLVQTAPMYARYAKTTSREIPMMLLRPADV